MPLKLDEIDLTRADLYRTGFPHDVFAVLRKDAPVWKHPTTPGLEQTAGDTFWVVSRAAEIREVSRRSELFVSSRGPGLADAGGGQDVWLTHMDGPAHLRQRKLISAGFTPRMIRRLEDLARDWAAKIVDAALERETVEFVEDVAYQLPMHMIADILGVPKEDRDWLFALTSDWLNCVDPQHPVPESKRSGLAVEIYRYGQGLAARKRALPEDDVLSLLVAVEDELGRLSDPELDAFFLLLTVAGSETTRSVIAAGLQQLLAEPAQLEALRRDPGLMRVATEELLRWSSPVAYFKRLAAADTEIAGVPIAKGDRVTLWFPSGNRDETCFQSPFRFDIRRQPNEHLTFGGGGPHFCLGAHLARREISILFEELFKRTSQIEPIGNPTYSVLGIKLPIIVSLGKLPVRLKAS